MINQTMANYDPRCSIYPKKERNGSTCYYISYFLPTGARMLRKGHKKKSEAKRLMHLKEGELLQGKFDEKDFSKMPHFRVQDRQGKEKWQVKDSYKVFLQKTAGKRKLNSQYNDKIVLKMMFERLAKKKRHLDEIKPMDIQDLFDEMALEGKSLASLKTYSSTLSKVFKWFIDDMEILDMRNPVKKIVLPQKQKSARPQNSAFVRERIPTESEIQALLNEEHHHKSKASSPIVDIVKFILFTGCRVGEALHLEWGEINLEEGTWEIGYKPHCPTFTGMGWSPKWDKPRKIFLLPEALEVLQAQPQYNEVIRKIPVQNRGYDDVVGKIPIRDKENTIIDYKVHPAPFVFPKREVWFRKKVRKVGYSRVDNIDTAWETLKRNANVTDLQLKDLRTYFNWVLVNHYHLSHKEAGSYIGNSEVVNKVHYSPVVQNVLREKIKQKSLSDIVGLKKKKIGEEK